MSENEFLAVLKELKVDLYIKHKEYEWSTPEFKAKKYNKKKPPEPAMDDYLAETWMSGGVGGGSCWDNDNSSHYSIDADPEPDFTSLDSVLEKVCPGITYLQYKKLASSLKIERHERHRDEYYGNSTKHTTKAIRIGDLYKTLLEMQVI